MCTTTKSHRNAILIIEEMTKLAGNGPIDVAFATACVGAQIEDMLYMSQISNSTLLTEEEILVVKVKDCTRLSLLAGFVQYKFSTEPDQLPEENMKLKFVDINELSEDVQNAINSVLEDFHTLWVA